MREKEIEKKLVDGIRKLGGRAYKWVSPGNDGVPCLLYTSYAYQAGQEEKYQVTILVPKTDQDTMARINAAIDAAKQKGAADKWNGVCPPVIQTPVYDGDGVRPSDGMPFGAECKGPYVFTASAKADYPPEVVDMSLIHIWRDERMRKIEHFFEETLPGQLLGTVCAVALPFLLLVLGVAV